MHRITLRKIPIFQIHKAYATSTDYDFKIMSIVFDQITFSLINLQPLSSQNLTPQTGLDLKISLPTPVPPVQPD